MQDEKELTFYLSPPFTESRILQATQVLFEDARNYDYVDYETFKVNKEHWNKYLKFTIEVCNFNGEMQND